VNEFETVTSFVSFAFERMHTGFMLCFAHHATRYVSGTVTWDLDVFWSIFVRTEMSWMFENYRQSQCLTMSCVLPVYEWCDKLSSVILCQHLFWKKAFRSWIGDRLNPPNRKPLIFICSLETLVGSLGFECLCNPRPFDW